MRQSMRSLLRSKMFIQQKSKNADNLIVRAAEVKKATKEARQGPNEPFIPRGKYMARISGFAGGAVHLWTPPSLSVLPKLVPKP